MVMSIEKNYNKCTFQTCNAVLVQWRSYSHRRYWKKGSFQRAIGVEEVAFDQLVVSIGLSPPAHPIFEQSAHALYDIIITKL